MGETLLPAIGTEILIPACSLVAIAFALLQWLIVSRVKLSPGGLDSAGANSGSGKNGYAEYLIEEEDGLNDHSVVLKCADIQNAISEGFSSLFFNFQNSIYFLISSLSVL